MTDYNCVIYPPSLIAVGAICVAADCLKITWRRKDITMLDYLQSLSNCEQVCVCVCVHAHAHVHACVCMCVCACMCMCVCVCF